MNKVRFEKIDKNGLKHSHEFPVKDRNDYLKKKFKFLNEGFKEVPIPKEEKIKDYPF